MLVTGPFALTINVPITESSPYIGTPSAVAAQVQNVSGFAILVTAGGEEYSIPPYTCATVPVDPATTSLTINPTQELFSVGAVTIAWLLARDRPPVPDGPIWSGSVGVPQKLLVQTITTTVQVVPIAAAFRTIELMVNPGPGNVPYRVVVLGNESAFGYIDTGSVSTLGPKRWVAHVNTAVDTELVVALVSGSAQPAGSWLTAELDAYDVVPDVTNVQGFTPIPVTATISGSPTVVANQGSPNTAPNSWPVLITDGTNTLGTAAHPVRVDPTGTTTQPVSGSVTTTPALHATPLDEPDVTISVTGTAVQLIPSLAMTTGVIVQALQQNTGTGANTLRVGSSAVAIGSPGRGEQLAPGQWVSVPIANLNDLYINGQAGDGVCVFGL